MATVRQSFNKNNSAVKRIMQEARELANDTSSDYSAAPLEDNIFEWHCTIRGPHDSEFEGGLYHLRILLPAEYPFRAPSVMMLTPSGRFETNTKICISFTNYHEEEWQPAWGVRTAIIGVQGFFGLKGTAAVGIGSMSAPASERRRLAKLSPDWICPQCNRPNRECLPTPMAEPKEVSASSISGSSVGAHAKADSDTGSAAAADSAPDVSVQVHVNEAEAKVETEMRRDSGATSCGPAANAGDTHTHNPASGSDSDLSPPAEGRSAALSPTPTVTTATTLQAARSSSSSLSLLRKRMADDTVGVALDATISVLVAFAAAIVIRKVVF